MEIEIKLRLADGLAPIRRKLRECGFRIVERRMLEDNLLLDTRDSSLATQGKLLRVRRVGRHHVLTYKGPAQPGRHKRRPEIETSIEDGGALQQILELVGFRPAFRYEKFRTEYAQPSGAGKVMLDETPIGNFLEIEGAARWIDQTARRLGFAHSDYITASYGRLYIDYCRERGRTPTNMLFPNRGGR